MLLKVKRMCGSDSLWVMQDKARRDKTGQCVALRQPDKARKLSPGFEKYSLFLKFDSGLANPL